MTDQQQNQYTMSPVKGLLNLCSSNHFACTIDATQVGTLYPGQPVKLYNRAGNPPYVVACTADYDDVFGFITFNPKDTGFKAGSVCDVSLYNDVMFMEASAPIARGVHLGLVISGTKVQTVVPGQTPIGIALDPAAANGDLIRVYIKTPADASEILTESDPLFSYWLLHTPPLYSETDPVFSYWLAHTPPLYSFTETDPIVKAIVGIVKSNGSLISAASAGADYEVPITFSTGLTRTVNTVTVNTSQNITTLSNLTTNGFIKTSGSNGTLSVDTNTYLTTINKTVLTTSATPYAVLTTDNVILASLTSAQSIVLPTAVGVSGKEYTIKKIGAGVTGVTISTTSSQTIDGALTQVIYTQYQSITVISDGANWQMI